MYHKATKKAIKKEPIPWIKVPQVWWEEACLGNEPNWCDQHHHKVKHKTGQARESHYSCKDSSNNRQKGPAANKDTTTLSLKTRKKQWPSSFWKKRDIRPVLSDFQIFLEILSTHDDILWTLLRWTHFKLSYQAIWQHKLQNEIVSGFVVYIVNASQWKYGFIDYLEIYTKHWRTEYQNLQLETRPGKIDQRRALLSWANLRNNNETRANEILCSRSNYYLPRLISKAHQAFFLTNKINNSIIKYTFVTEFSIEIETETIDKRQQRNKTTSLTRNILALR